MLCYIKTHYENTHKREPEYGLCWPARGQPDTAAPGRDLGRACARALAVYVTDTRTDAAIRRVGRARAISVVRVSMADYSKWKHLDDGDPEPEDLPTPEQQRAGRHPEDAGSAEANSGSTEKKGKKHRRNTPKTARVESAYVPSFGGQAGRFILLRVLPRFNPMLTPEDEARIVQALKQVDGVHDAKVDTKTKTATITGPRGVFSKNPATAKLLKAVEAAGLPGYDESVTMSDAEGKRAAAAAAECAGGHAMLQHIESRLGKCCFWCWLAVGTAVGASAMGLQQPCTWCLQTVHAVDLRELSCEVLCGDRSRVLWTRWNPVSVVVCGLESAGYVEIFAMMFCAHTPSTIFDSSASFDTPCSSKIVTRGFFLHTYSRRVIFICLFYRLWGCFGTVDGATNQSIIGRFMRVYSRISMCLLVFPETDNIFMLHFVLLMWSTSELTRCASFTMPSHLTEGAPLNHLIS
eukprot:COSAG02_NODE_3113_length_7338_cov_2.845559_7_plen_464_part_00